MNERPGAAALMAGIGAGLILAAGGYLTGPAAFLLRLLPRRFGRYLLEGEFAPLHARVLGIYLGLALAAACGFALWLRRLRRRPDCAFLKTGRGKLLVVLLAVLALLTLSLSVNRAFWDDEIEHIHAAWYVHHGRVPYRDFFEHHHPLLWFLLAPLISLLGEGLAVLAAARLLMLLLAAGIAWLTWRIARQAAGGAEAGCWAVAVLFSNFLFLPCVMEVRPDVPMAFLALAAVERLLAYIKDGRGRTLLAAAFLASLSFLFLQKAVFLFPVAVALLAGWRLKGRIGPALLWKAAAAFLLPVSLFAAWLAATGSFRDYFFCNWLLNAGREGALRLWLTVGLLALVNAAFWLSLAPASWRALRSERSSAALRAVAWFALAALAALALLPNPADRHFLLALPLLSVIVGAWAGEGSRFPLPGRWRAAFLAALLVIPLPFLIALNVPLNGVQLEKIAYVLQQTAPDDRVLDGRCDFNLFRPDVHYFWFQTGPGEMLDNYRRLRGGRRGDYEACRLAREHKPRFIMLDNREWTACRVWREYEPTRYPRLFIRTRAAIQADGT